MKQIWLHGNKRLLLPALAAWLIFFTAAGLWLAWGPAWSLLWRATGLLALALVMAYLARMTWLVYRPRIVQDGEHLLLYLTWLGPIRVPMGVVECFLLGEAAGRLAGTAGKEVVCATLTIRLAERATEWAQRDVSPVFSRWCGGHITLLGQFCEPLNVSLVQSLNDRLVELKKAHKAALKSTLPMKTA